MNKNYEEELLKYKRLMSITISVSGLDPSKVDKLQKKREKLQSLTGTKHAANILADIRDIFIKNKINYISIDTNTLSDKIMEQISVDKNTAGRYAREIKDNPFAAFNDFYYKYVDIVNRKELSDKAPDSSIEPKTVVNNSELSSPSISSVTSRPVRENIEIKSVDNSKILESALYKFNNKNYDLSEQEKNAVVVHYFNNSLTNVNAVNRNSLFNQMVLISKSSSKKDWTREELIELGKACENVIIVDLLNGGLNRTPEIAELASKLHISDAYSLYINAYNSYAKNNETDPEIIKPDAMLNRVNSVVMNKIISNGLDLENEFDLQAYRYACKYMTSEQIAVVYKKHMEHYNDIVKFSQAPMNPEYSEKMQEMFAEIISYKQYATLSDKDKKNYSIIENASKIIEDFFGEEVISSVYKEPETNREHEESEIVGYNQEQLQEQIENVSKWNNLLGKIKGKGRTR